MSPPGNDGRLSFIQWNRSLSVRQNRNSGGRPSSGSASGKGRGFTLSSLRGSVQPELSKRLFRLIKSENNLVGAHQDAARERGSIATQLSEWGEQTGDEAVSDISDKVGVVLSEIGEQEDNYAHAIDESRSLLKTIRNIEKSVQPSRDHKARIADEIAKLKSKEPENTKLVVLEQELVRAEAENLVAEAQLSNVTRQKLRETFNTEFAAIIERAEKQIILARHGQRLLKLLDDSPVVPGDTRVTYNGSSQARQILNDAEDDLRDWRPDHEGDDAPHEERQQDPSPEASGYSKGDNRAQHRGESGYGQRGSRNYDPANDYEGGGQALDFGADRDREYVAGQDLNRAGGQGASNRMMSGGSGAVESRESEIPDVETGRSAPGGVETGRGGWVDTQTTP